MTRLFGPLLMISLLASAAVAQQPASPFVYTPPTAPPPLDPLAVMIRLVGLTLFTLVVCGGVVWWARRTGRAKVSVSTDPSRLAKTGQLAIDPRCTLHLLRVDGRQVVVTTDHTGLRSIVPLQDQFDAVLGEELTPLSPGGRGVGGEGEPNDITS
jgi:hypothetical protein